MEEILAGYELRVDRSIRIGSQETNTEALSREFGEAG